MRPTENPSLGQDPGHAELVRGCLPFIRQMAHRHCSAQIPAEDLINEGVLGAFEAASRFDAGKDLRFLTYAAWWIRKTILAACHRSQLVQTPWSRATRLNEYRRSRDQLAQQLGRNPTRDEVALRMDMPQSRIERLLDQRVRSHSLDEPLRADSSASLGDRLADNASSPESDAIDGSMRSELRRGLGMLTERERRVLSYRFGLQGDRPLSLTETGALLRLSRERVRQIEVRARRSLLGHVQQSYGASSAR